MTAVDDLKDFVANYFDGSVSRCIELDELLWQVRLANRHEPNMLHYEGGPLARAEETTELNLEELGL